MDFKFTIDGIDAGKVDKYVEYFLDRLFANEETIDVLFSVAEGLMELAHFATMDGGNVSESDLKYMNNKSHETIASVIEEMYATKDKKQ